MRKTWDAALGQEWVVTNLKSEIKWWKKTIKIYRTKFFGKNKVFDFFSQKFEFEIPIKWNAQLENGRLSQAG